ncbi:hypothetical protein C8R46DRAFT_1327615 [Mycena filopes]|nr:hypothetical protein C8R46DRAFT_1327615 [Mycena filopes]
MLEYLRRPGILRRQVPRPRATSHLRVSVHLKVVAVHYTFADSEHSSNSGPEASSLMRSDSATARANPRIADFGLPQLYGLALVSHTSTGSGSYINLRRHLLLVPLDESKHSDTWAQRSHMRRKASKADPDFFCATISRSLNVLRRCFNVHPDVTAVLDIGIFHYPTAFSGERAAGASGDMSRTFDTAPPQALLSGRPPAADSDSDSKAALAHIIQLHDAAASSDEEHDTTNAVVHSASASSRAT